MRLRHGLAVLLWFGTACGDDDGASDDDLRDAAAMDARVDADIDARVERDTGAPDSELPVSGPLDAAQLPTDPTSVSVQLQMTGCFGSCPAYRVRVDQTGQVSFWGGGCSARPGVFTKAIAPSSVQSFYDQLRASPYFSLGNQYVDFDTCPTLVSDAPAQFWDVIVDGVRKPLTRDEGCSGVPGLEAVDALVPQLVSVTDIQSWIGDGQSCELIRGDAPLGELASSYRLARDGKPLAMLHFVGRSFRLAACDGSTLATGTTLSATFTAFLVDERDVKLQLGELELGSIALLRPTANEALVAYGIRESDELRLGFVEAERCTAD